MKGLANAAVATFLVEALLRYIGGDFIGIAFLGEVGTAAGNAGGLLLFICLEISPVRYSPGRHSR